MKIGITERGDPAFINDLDNRLLKDGNIIISKNILPIMDIILKNKNIIILHSTITGYGGSAVEPNVPFVNDSISNLKLLIDKGFPIKNIVGRVDPIIPSKEGINIALNVIYKLIDLDIKRIRFSFIDIYKKVEMRFKQNNLYNMLSSIDKKYENNFLDKIDKIKEMYNVSFESCAEINRFQTGCISKKDLEIFGIDNKNITGSSNQRMLCLCPSCKTEILNEKKRCPHKCLYCYWND